MLSFLLCGVKTIPYVQTKQWLVNIALWQRAIFLSRFMGSQFIRGLDRIRWHALEHPMGFLVWLSVIIFICYVACFQLPMCYNISAKNELSPLE